jgi:ABC-2 type transport system permease protein
MKAIIQREFESYFNTMVGYIFVAICMLVCGVFFTSTNIIGGSASFVSVVSSVSYALILITPILTMRSFAEERKSKSDQLLLTAPVSIPGIVMGKYLSAMLVLLITLGATLVFPISLALFGEPYWSEILLGYIGMALLGGTFIAIGLFISSITENQLTACILTLGLLFFLWLSDSLIPSLTNETLYTILRALSLYGQFSAFTNGVLNVATIVYFLSVTFLFLFFAAKAVERRRWSKN